MNSYLTEWAAQILSSSSMTLRAPVEVVGIRDQHMGPRWEFAQIKVKIEPADSFEVQIDPLARAVDSDENGYLDWAIMGLLDVLLTAETRPLKNIRVTFIEAKNHPVDSSQMAFRHAGRDAARNVFQIMKDNAFSSAA
jgi:hypothetical protein